MITVRGRELVIPIREREIGTTYDNNAETRTFLIERVTAGGMDLSHLSYRLDLEYRDNIKDTCILDKEVGADTILLTWTVPDSCVEEAGTVWIAIRAFDEYGTVKWATARGAVYVIRTIDTPGSYTGKLTEMEQIEKRIDTKTSSLDESEAKRKENERIRQQNEQNRLDNEARWQVQAETAIREANESVSKSKTYSEVAEKWAVGNDGIYENNNAKYYKEEAQRISSEALRDLTGARGQVEQVLNEVNQKLIDGEFHGPQGETGKQGEKGEQGESGVTVPVTGFFTFSGDSDGNLWCYYTGSTPPAFETEENGDIYMLL